MANSDKDILITPNKGSSSAVPEINFVGQGNNPIKLRVLDDNTVSFEGSQGQLFSIDNNLTSGIIFAASDISGVPSIAVDANGRIDIARYNGTLNVGPNSNTTDRVLGVTGEIMITNPVGSTTPAAVCFSEGGTISGTPAAKLLWDGPNFSDNNNYFSVWTNGGDRLTVTYGGGVGINSNNPRVRFQIFGEHNDTSMRLTLPAALNGAANGEVNMHLWVSEPGLTWTGGGIGLNVTNYRTYSYPSAASDSGNSYMPRLNTNIGQAFIRFLPDGGQMTFSTTDNNNTQYRDVIRIQQGTLNINASTNTSYRLNVGGNINFTGTLYQNGSPFVTLPAQSAATIGAALRSDGTNAFWDIGGGGSGGGTSALPYAAEDRYRVGFQITRGYGMGGYQNSSSFKNVCSLNMAANTITNHGDILSNGQGYCAGAQNISMYGYVMIAVNGVGGTGATCSKINMNTNANAGTTSINNNRSATSLMKRDFRYAYVYGGGDSRPDRFNLSNDTSALAPNGNPAGDENNPAGGNGATYGWTRKNGAYLYAWASETYSAWPNSPGTDGSNKTLSARHGYNYWNTAGGYRTSSNLSKRSSYTGSEATQVGKFDCGEETFFTGMNRGYMCGMYNGAQNNQGAVLNYAAETFTADSNINRVGPPGSASGAGTEFGTVLSGYDGV